jgi:NitT/TauT family transport system substrate-binding protein
VAALLVALLMASAARPGESAEKLRAAYPVVNIAMTPAWIAKDLGFFREEGLDVEMVYISGATAAVQALLAGDIQAGIAVGIPPVVTAILQGADLIVPAVSGNRLNSVLVSRTPVRAPEELAGKRFGITTRGSPAELVTRIALRQLGIDPARVLMVPVGDQSLRITALSAGHIDATVLTWHELNQVQDQRQFHVLLDLAKAEVDFPYHNLVVTRQLASQKRPVVLGMIRALVKAVRFMRANREESVRVAARWIRTTETDRLQGQWRLIAFDEWQDIPRPSESGFRFVIDGLVDRYPKAATLKLSDVFDASFVEELERAGFFANK